MIKVTSLNKTEFILNADHIEKLEEVPETIITLINGKKYIVIESIDEVIKRTVEYKRNIFTFNIQEASK